MGGVGSYESRVLPVSNARAGLARSPQDCVNRAGSSRSIYLSGTIILNPLEETHGPEG